MIRTAARWLLAVLYGVAGYFHLAAPGPFLRIVPAWVPAPATVIGLTGMAELLGAAGLLQPWSIKVRNAAGAGLALYALCVWPANFHHMALDLGAPRSRLGPGLSHSAVAVAAADHLGRAMGGRSDRLALRPRH